MKKQNYEAPAVPTANIAVNKSRIKLYTKGLDMPTYYLQKGQEFQIEIFNSTSDVILAKVILNGKAISQGGLVLNPGQRVFLDRYFDVAKKFLFDTYEVANTNEVKKAIENNGDIKIEFYREIVPLPTFTIPETWVSTYVAQRDWLGNYPNGTDMRYLKTNSTGILNNVNTTESAKSLLSFNSVSGNLTNVGSASSEVTYTAGACAYGSSFGTLDMGPSLEEPKPMKRSIMAKKRSIMAKKSIETGRVEQGSNSDQKFRKVNKDFEFIPFHTVEYKMLPISQKVNTISDVNIKRYCTNCGSKLGKTDKFCSNCGTKA